MKNKGFTLVELLAVLVILAIIALIVTPIVSGVIKDAGEKVYKEQEKTILRSAQKWALANSNSLSTTDGAVYNLSLSDLKNSAYYDNTTVINPDTKQEMNGCIKITYREASQDYKYEYVESTCTTGPNS